MLKIEISEYAFNEIEESKDFYNLQKVGLGDDFKKDIQNAIKSISHNPNLYPQIDARVRRCLLHRFPFSIFYSTNETTAIILSVAHQHRKPRY